MGERRTLAVLLRRTLLANDDAVLEFLTPGNGRISVFAKKFARSKKRAEIDFFRLLELELFVGRNSRSLRGATTMGLWPGFEADLKCNEIGWAWLRRLQDLPEEKADEQVFREVMTLGSGFDPVHAEWFDLLLRMRLLQHGGQCPRFDEVRGEVWFDPQSGQFSTDARTGWLHLSNEERQVCEFLRRTDPGQLGERCDQLPMGACTRVAEVVSGLEENIH